METEPPLADQRGHERGDETADIDEDVEDLEAGIALSLGPFELLGAFLGRVGLEIVIELADDGLEIPLEKAVAEGDQEERQAGQGQEPDFVLRGREDRDGEEHIAEGHDDETALDRPLVVGGPVRDDTADQGEDVDAAVEEGIDESRLGIGQTELGAEEKGQDRIHDVVAETLAHVAESGGQQSFRMIFEHIILSI